MSVSNTPGYQKKIKKEFKKNYINIRITDH